MFLDIKDKSQNDVAKRQLAANENGGRMTVRSGHARKYTLLNGGAALATDTRQFFRVARSKLICPTSNLTVIAQSSGAGEEGTCHKPEPFVDKHDYRNLLSPSHSWTSFL